jgi:Ca-activated chloride channel family protein
MTTCAAYAFGMALLTSLLLAQPPFRVSVRLVTVTAVVTDPAGRYVRNLKAEDFSIHEDGVPQKIAFFRHDPDSALSVGIVFDLRNTMKKKMKVATYAADYFVRHLRGADSTFLLTFDNSPTLRQEFSRDHAATLRNLRSLRLGRHGPPEQDGPALLAALEKAVNEIGKGRTDQRGILLITDRQDQSSYRNADGFKIKLFGFSAVFTPDRLGSEDGPVLNSEMYVERESRALNEFLDQADARLRNQYTLAYYSTHADGGRHDIRVTATPPNIVQARTR